MSIFVQALLPSAGDVKEGSMGVREAQKATGTNFSKVNIF